MSSIVDFHVTDWLNKVKHEWKYLQDYRMCLVFVYGL